MFLVQARPKHPGKRFYIHGRFQHIISFQAQVPSASVIASLRTEFLQQSSSLQRIVAPTLEYGPYRPEFDGSRRTSQSSWGLPHHA